jgi:hypothetical protein
MEEVKKYIKYLPWAIASVLAILMIRGCGKEPIKQYVPVEVRVEVPSVEKVFDTVYEPVPYPVKVKEIDSVYYGEYKKLRDSIQKDSMFREAIRINEYNQKFEDTLQTINVYSKTRGKLLEQSVKYTTKPYYITVKDSVEIKTRTKVFIGAEAGVPTLPGISTRPVLKGNIIIQNKRDNTISISYDTEGRAWLGKTWKIRLRK